VSGTSETAELTYGGENNRFSSAMSYLADRCVLPCTKPSDGFHGSVHASLLPFFQVFAGDQPVFTDCPLTGGFGWNTINQGRQQYLLSKIP
jgi:hypothetical protein